MSDKVDSTSNERIKNNVVRHEYKILNDQEKAQVLKIKDLGLEFIEYLAELGGPNDATRTMGSRELSIARTKIEEAVLWAVKHVTA